MTEQQIKAMMVIEMMGRPAEHLQHVMKDFLKRLDSEKGIKIENKKIHSPKLYEEKDEAGNVIAVSGGKELYSTFSEIEVSAENIFYLIRVVFTYMPSHVEIISPMDFKLKNFDISSVLNEITKKLHQYDAIAKNSLMQNQILYNKLTTLQQQLGMNTNQEGVQQSFTVNQGKEKTKDKTKTKTNNKQGKKKKK